MRHNHNRRKANDRSTYDTVYVDLPKFPYYRYLYVDPIKTRFVNFSAWQDWNIDRVFTRFDDFMDFCERAGADLV